MNFFQKYAAGGALRPDSFTGMNPDFSTALQSMIAGAPADVQQALQIYSGYRSPQKQQQLWNDALAKYGSPEAARKWVAPPGRSNHNHGLAADLKFLGDGAKSWVHDNASNYGLAFPLANEPWHVELASARGGKPANAGAAINAQMAQGVQPKTIAAEPMDRPAAITAMAPEQSGGTSMAANGPKMPQGIGGLGGLGGFVPPQADDGFDTGGLLRALAAAAFAGDASVIPQMLSQSEAQRDKRYDRQYDRAWDQYTFGSKLEQDQAERKDTKDYRDRSLNIQEAQAKEGGMTADMRNYNMAMRDPAFAKFVGAGNGGKPPSIVEQFDENGAPRKMIWDPDAGQYVPFGGSKAAPDSSGYDITLPDGTHINAGGKLTEGQSKDVGFYQRGNAALDTLDSHENALTAAGDKMLSNLPGGNYLTGEPYQVADQAGREFLAAILRKDSGAALTSEEMANYGKTYLPQPGDSEGLIQQKRASRRRAMEAIKLGLGTASDLSRAPVTQNPKPDQIALPEGVTEDDITHTMQVRGMTREQVLEKLGMRNATMGGK